jgi:hypothetical protein
VRLATCIALELAVVAGAAGGVWVGATQLAARAEPQHDVVVAAVAASLAAPVAPIERVAALEVAPRAITPPVPDNVFGAPDAELLAPIGATPLIKVKLNRGGTSLSLRLDFASGARAAFKPLQVHPQSDPRREIAAYRVDRLLGLGHVPPAKPAAFTVQALVAAIEPASRAHAIQRITDEGLARRGVLVGELSWWVPEIKAVRIGGHLIDEPAGEAVWTGYLQAGVTRPVELAPLLTQIATAIVFDVVIDNSDRWSGNNTQGSSDNRILYFMDNTLSFSQFTLGHATNLSKLHRIQVFPRSLIAKLRALTVEALAASIGPDDDLLGPLLSPAELRAVVARRDHVVAYVDRLIGEHGDSAILALP